MSESECCCHLDIFKTVRMYRKPKPQSNHHRILLEYIKAKATEQHEATIKNRAAKQKYKSTKNKLTIVNFQLNSSTQIVFFLFFKMNMPTKKQTGF